MTNTDPQASFDLATGLSGLKGGDDPAPVRFLDAAGNWDPSDSAAPFAAALAEITAEELKAWYSDMVVTRAFDRECTNLQRQGHMALWVPSVGQEGCQVGFANAADTDDYIFPAYREHTVARVRGVDLVDVGKLFRGAHNSGWDPKDPKNGNTHIYTLVLGAQAQHAVGHSLAQLLDAKQAAGVNTMDPGEPGTATGKATMVFYGDGTTSQGDTNEALIFAASYQTPTLFIVQNNRWAISVPVSRQSRTPLYRRALGFGIPAVQIDGNDPLAAYAVAKTFLDDAKNGGGPRYIEALTYRIGAHTTSDDPTRYRDAEELKHWQESDPINRLAHYLRSQGVTDEFFASVDDTAASEAHRVREALLSIEKGHPDSMFAHVYAENHPLIDEQRAWMAAYEASFEESAE
ncbi:thiamine pyrophosphate-dependent enzyme [Canibacter zhoujuaniae]|uniref:thiamine pyrophosphate-dependent enzyme n=1 Tax=Canibacter zhoujuaniae TaxID=2708343 RepID=UPI0014212A05|nr:thiamine pyrophosphate-dependent enzyme [Canibacter zhoujuaniae]